MELVPNIEQIDSFRRNMNFNVKFSKPYTADPNGPKSMIKNPLKNPLK